MLLALLAILGLPTGAFGAAGAIDFSFGGQSDGFARFSTTAKESSATLPGVVTTSTGSYVVGSVGNPSTAGPLQLISFTGTTGAPKSDFGTSGLVSPAGIYSGGRGGGELAKNVGDDAVVLAGTNPIDDQTANGGRIVLQKFDGLTGKLLAQGSSNVLSPLASSNPKKYYAIRAAALAVGSDKKIYVAAVAVRPNYSKNDDLVIARFNPDLTIDATWPSSAGKQANGVDTIDLGGSDEVRALAFDSAGNLVVGGVERTISGSTVGADQALVVRLKSTGALDTTFAGGKGWLTFDASGNANPDSVEALAIDGLNRIDATGLTGGAGAYAARIGSTGTLDTAFGGTNTGIVRFNFSAANTGESRALLLDGNNLLVGGDDVGGVSPSQTRRWAAARLTATGALDTTFGTGGKVVATQACTGTTTPLVTGITKASNGRYILGGLCGDAQTAALLRLLGDSSGPALGSASLTVSPDTRAAGHEVTKADNFPSQAISSVTGGAQSLGFNSGSFHSGGFNSGGFNSGGFNSGGFNSGGFNSGGFNSGGFNSGSFHSGGFNSGGFNSGSFHSGPFLSPQIASAIPLIDMPLSDPAGTNASLSWPWVLQGTKYDGAALNTVTLQDVFDLRYGGSAPTQFAQRFDDLRLNDADITRTPLRRLTFGGLMSSEETLNNLRTPDQGTWCDFLRAARPDGGQQPYRCEEGVDPTKATLADLEFRGDDLTAYLSKPLPVTANMWAGRFSLLVTDLRQVPAIGSLNAYTARALTTCDPSAAGSPCAPGTTKTLLDLQTANPAGWSNATIKDALAYAPGLTVGQVIAGVVQSSALAVEDLSPSGLATLLDAADIRTTDNHTATVSFTLDCDQRIGRTLSVKLTVPAGFRYVPRTATIAENGGSPATVPAADVTQSGRDITFVDTPGALLPACTSSGDAGTKPTIALKADLEPKYGLGSAGGSSVVVSLGSEQQTATAGGTTVDDSHDAGDTAAGARTIGAQDVTTGYLSRPGDVDLYKLHVPSDAAVGTRVSFTLSHLPVDADLVVLGPAAGVPNLGFNSGGFNSGGFNSGGFNSGGFNSGGFNSGGLPDDTAEPGSDPGTQQPNALQDIPIPSISGEVVRNASIRRGTANESATVILGEGDRGQDLYAQVSGYNQATSNDPYILRTIIDEPSPPRPCITRSHLSTGSAGTFPDLSNVSGKETIILTDPARMDLSSVNASLQNYANQDSVKGLIVPVEADPTVTGVTSAYNAWDDSPCSVDKVDNVATAIDQVIAHVRKNMTNLKSIVVVGGDDVIPYGRTPDLTQQANESEHADELAFNAHDNPISRSLRNGYFLTDDHLGDFEPRASFGGATYDPQVAIGRLVETPDQVKAQLDQYVNTNGVLNPGTARITGYDFFTDSATDEASALTDNVPSGAVSTKITSGSSPWTASDALGFFNNGGAGYISVNAHYNEGAAQPASNFYGADQGIIRTTDVHPAAGSILFTMGCHAGLNIPDGLTTAPGTTEANRLADWPETLGASKDVYVASTGYGLGDDAANAYTERLLTYNAQNLGGTMTVGQALMFAKQRYIGEESIKGAIPPFDSKAISEAAFYGLPNYVIGSGGKSAPSVVQPPAGSEPTTVTLKTSDFSSGTIVNAAHTTSKGTYWTVHHNDTNTDDAPLVEHYRPIQPRTQFDVTPSDGLPVHGFLITSLASSDTTNVNGVFDLPLPAGGPSAKPEPSGTDVFFPASLPAVNRQLTPAGRRDTLSLATGQFFSTPTGAPGTGTQRLFSSIGGVVYRSDSTDYAEPTFTSVSGVVSGPNAIFDVTMRDTDVTRVHVMFRTDDGTGKWYGTDLPSATGTRFLGGSPLPSGATKVTEFIVGAVRKTGAVGYTTNKGPGYEAKPVANSGGPTTSVSGTSGGSGYYTSSSVTVSVTPGASQSGVTFQYTIDKDTTRHDYTGPVTVSGEGGHLVQFYGSDGSYASASAVIDSVAPNIDGAPTTAPNSAGWYTSPVTVKFTCDDPVPGSGVASCGPDQTVSTDGKDKPVTGTAKDVAGNTATKTVKVNVDQTKPAGTIDGSGTNLNLIVGKPVTGTATDATSGVGKVRVTYTPTLGGSPQAYDATLTCNTDKTSCTWSAPSPSGVLAVYNMQAVITDVAGNTANATGPSQITILAG